MFRGNKTFKLNIVKKFDVSILFNYYIATSEKIKFKKMLINLKEFLSDSEFKEYKMFQAIF